MPWTPPSDPVTSTVITVAYAVANLLTQIRWLRLLTGNADPPGSAYVVVSDSTAATSWKKVPSDALATGAALANLAVQSVPNDRLATDAVDDRVLAAGAALANLAVQSVPNDRLATDAVDDRVLAAGAALANLGYAPVNRDGDSGVGSLAFATGRRVSFASENGTKVNLTASDGEYGLGVSTAFLNLFTNRYIGFHNQAAAPGDNSVIIDTQFHQVTLQGSISGVAGTFSGAVTAGSLAGAAAAQFAPFAHTHDAGGGGTTPVFPSGLGCWVRQASEIPGGWLRETLMDGLIPVGAGSSFGQTFAENTGPGTSWQHQHSGNSFAVAVSTVSVSVSVSGSATGGAADNTGGPSATNGLATAGGVNLPTVGHTHSLNGVSLAVSASGGGSGTGSGTATGATANATWLPPMRAVVWIRKS